MINIKEGIQGKPVPTYYAVLGTVIEILGSKGCSKESLMCFITFSQMAKIFLHQPHIYILTAKKKITMKSKLSPYLQKFFGLHFLFTP